MNHPFDPLCDRYDVVVIGAGPAGAMAALHTARAGVNVLLVDRAAFPREKVCGCCLNGWTLAMLRDAGLRDQLQALQPQPLTHLHLRAGRHAATLPLPGGAAVSRSQLDAMLAKAAVEAGATFIDDAQAQVVSLTPGRVQLRSEGQTRIIESRVTLVADGLSGSALRQLPGFEPIVHQRSRMGLGAQLSEAEIAGDTDAMCPRGRIIMHCGRGGYVGMVRLQDGRIDIAASMDPVLVRQQGGPQRAVAALLGVSLPEARWHGAAALTRHRRRLAGPGLLVIGDAAGYVEPFTGEGIAWALAGGMAVADLAVAGTKQWHASLEQTWPKCLQHIVQRRQVTCRVLAAVLRRPRLSRCCVATLAHLPWLAQPVLRAMARATPRSRSHVTPHSLMPATRVQPI